MTEARRAAAQTYVWQAEKPLRLSRGREIVKGETFTPGRRVIAAFGDLMATVEDAEQDQKIADIEAKAAEEVAAAQAARAEAEAKRAETEAQAQAKRATTRDDAPAMPKRPGGRESSS